MPPTYQPFTSSQTKRGVILHSCLDLPLERQKTSHFSHAPLACTSMQGQERATKITRRSKLPTSPARRPSRSRRGHATARPPQPSHRIKLHLWTKKHVQRISTLLSLLLATGILNLQRADAADQSLFNRRIPTPSCAVFPRMHHKRFQHQQIMSARPQKHHLNAKPHSFFGDPTVLDPIHLQQQQH